jgi:hypothetical protein
LFTEEKRVSLYQTNNFLSNLETEKKKLDSSIFWAVNKYIAYFGFAMGDNFFIHSLILIDFPEQS